jgi:N-acetyl-anhydromuramyl-L-alanine amidase AmpD
MISCPLTSHGELKPYGLLVHTTGDGLAAKVDPDDQAKAVLKTYSNMKEGPHYAICPDGTLIRFREPETVSWHAGVSASDRASFLNGTWETDGRVPANVRDWWHARWDMYKVASPQHIYPGKSPNGAYVGVELIPCGVYNKATWTPTLGTPAAHKQRYTAIQYARLGELYAGLHKRFGWTLHARRFLGHEDVNPITRPGWDPGAYHGWFSWGLAFGIAAALINPESI